MLREVSLAEISDGRLYTANDLVRADAGGCSGCSYCCRAMVDTIYLDPYDFWQLSSIGETFASMMQAHTIGLDLADGLILPHFQPGPDGACPYLSEAGRCRVHSVRPGFCRLFPLGRSYQGRDFRYILQVHECRKDHLAKVKVKKWLQLPELSRYEDYVRQWHFFLRDLEAFLDREGSEALRKSCCMQILQGMYAPPWESKESFYPQFEARMEQVRRGVGFA